MLEQKEVVAQNVLISIKPKYVQNILAGEKTIEIRRGRVSLEIGTVLWVYATLPVGRIELHARVADLYCGAPSTIWKKFGKYTSLTRAEYYAYIDGADKVTAIRLESVKEVKPAPELNVLRATKQGFQPPQSYIRLLSGNPLLKKLLQLAQQPAYG